MTKSEHVGELLQRAMAQGHFVVRGSSKMGDIKIVHPQAWHFGPLTVHRPFRITRKRG